MKLYNLKILSQLILELERSDFFQIEALGLKKAIILEQRGAAAPLAPPLDTPLMRLFSMKPKKNYIYLLLSLATRKKIGPRGKEDQWAKFHSDDIIAL